jgi:histidyl-tRNA synthetase
VLKADTSTTAPVLVTLFDAADPAATLAIAATLRDAGVGVETYLERRKLDKQLKYASKRGFALVVVAGPDEVAAGTATVKDLRSFEQQVVPLADLPAVVRGLLGQA